MSIVESAANNRVYRKFSWQTVCSINLFLTVLQQQLSSCTAWRRWGGWWWPLMFDFLITNESEKVTSHCPPRAAQSWRCYVVRDTDGQHRLLKKKPLEKKSLKMSTYRVMNRRSSYHLWSDALVVVGYELVTSRCRATCSFPRKKILTWYQ